MSELENKPDTVGLGLPNIGVKSAFYSNKCVGYWPSLMKIVTACWVTGLEASSVIQV